MSFGRLSSSKREQLYDAEALKAYRALADAHHRIVDAFILARPALLRLEEEFVVAGIRFVYAVRRIQAEIETAKIRATRP